MTDVVSEPTETTAGATPPGAPVQLRTRLEELAEQQGGEVDDNGRRTHDDHGHLFDKTSLHADAEGYLVHRDYAAHYFRWGWATSRVGVGLGQKKVLDIGCGDDVALFKVANYMNMMPAEYVGVDLNTLKRKLSPSQAKRGTLYPKTNFIDKAAEIIERHGLFDRVVCFEVIEHMTPEAGWQLLWWMRRALKPDGVAVLSTPVFDGHQAHNHIHEWTQDELRTYIEAAGFEVRARYGTFASWKDQKTGLDDYAQRRGLDARTLHTLLEDLRHWHSTDVLSTFVAPVIPDYARNVAWHLLPKSIEG